MSASAGRPASDFGWFSTWVHQRLLLGLTFARGLSREQMLAGLGFGSRGLGEETFEAAESRTRWGGPPRIRLGQSAGWAYAVEGSTRRGSRRLGTLSLAAGEAFALVYTVEICTFGYYAAGEFVSGFDLTVPHIRWGHEPRRFDAEIEQAGFLRPHGADHPALSARFVQLVFGITIDQGMLEGPLPSGPMDLEDWL